jgi:hypothetical protein
MVHLAFFEFTTGTPHPLSSMHTVLLPPLSPIPDAVVNAEALGDHILVFVGSANPGSKTVIYLVSWKSGTVTLVSVLNKSCPVLYSGKSLKLRESPDRWTIVPDGGARAIVINNSLIALINNRMNNLEICELEVIPPGPCLKTLCFLELPPLMAYAHLSSTVVFKEWVPTSEVYARSRSSRGYHHLPFFSSTIGTIGLILYYQPRRNGYEPSAYAMIISVSGLLSAIRTDVRNVPWVDWGPSSTDLFRIREESLLLPIPAGPFWMISKSWRMVVREYDLRRTGYTQPTSEGTSSLQSWPPNPSESVEVLQYDVQTYLPYHDVVMDIMNAHHFTLVVADREWVVGLKYLVRDFCVHMVEPFLYELITRADRKGIFLSLCIT